jgi:hypothetical protein
MKFQLRYHSKKKFQYRYHNDSSILRWSTVFWTPGFISHGWRHWEIKFLWFTFNFYFY